MTWQQLSLFTDEELGLKQTYGLIGLSGYARSGKDTVAKILIDKYGYTRIGFADSIREFLLRINPILSDGHRLGEYVKMYGWEITKAQTEVRRLLQETGTVARDMFGADFWVSQVVREMGKNPDKKYVITDVRFQNEASMIKLNGGQIWRVERPEVSAINNHISESDMDNYTPDQLIINSGSIEELELLIKTRMLDA